jgi:hypothetical protein
MRRTAMIEGMSESSAPPPGGRPVGAGGRELSFDLAAAGGFKKLLGGRGPSRLVLTPEEIVIEHGESLRAPLRFAPGAVTVATVDPGRASVGKGGIAMGRFPVLHRLGPSQVVPRELGITGWLWTSSEDSAFTVLGADAPNVALLFSPPLSGAVVEEAFEPSVLEELAKRAPLGEPALFGLLLRAEQPDRLRQALDRYALLRDLTDREVPPVQRRHLPDDKEANPSISMGETSREDTSIPPPGRS